MVANCLFVLTVIFLWCLMQTYFKWFGCSHNTLYLCVLFSLEQGLEEMKKLLLLLLGCAVQVRAQFSPLKQLHTSHMCM